MDTLSHLSPSGCSVRGRERCPTGLLPNSVQTTCVARGARCMDKSSPKGMVRSRRISRAVSETAAVRGDWKLRAALQVAAPAAPLVETTDPDTKEEEENEQVGSNLVHNAQLGHWIRQIKSMLESVGEIDGGISGSPYDAAWVGLIPAVDGAPGKPQFPVALDWVCRSQLPDGSWAGDIFLFNPYDRINATMACVVALRTWSLEPEAVRRGCAFLNLHLEAVDRQEEIHRTVGFEMVFPAMLERARALELDLPYSSPAVTTILQERERKLKQIPVGFLQSQPNTLLASLEGIEALEGIDWDKILQLQSPAGHFLTSPASTACSFMHTGDPTALDYLTRLVDSTDGAVPNHAPVDIFERLWVVDRLQRLGISRYFKDEIKSILDFVYEHWDPQLGLSWAVDCKVTDLDDTSMGFRLLRQHGYSVSEDVFKPYRKGDGFSCWIDHGKDLDGDLTPMYNLHRASQVRFPGENLLEDAWAYTRHHLQEIVRRPQLLDRWVVAKDLRGEFEYGLNSPWYASFARMETRSYIDQYGPDDVWIAKSLYRMYRVCNSAFLSLAKTDYNMCQAMYRNELQELKRWLSDCGFDKLPFARTNYTLLVTALLCAAGAAFEPEMAGVRRTFVQVMISTTLADDYTTLSGAPVEEIQQFEAATRGWDPSMIDSTNQRQRTVFMGIYNTIHEISRKASKAQGRDVSNHVHQVWQRFATSVRIRAEWERAGVIPSWDEFVPVGNPSIAVEACSVLSSFFVPGAKLADEVLLQDFHHLNSKGGMVARLLNDIRSYESAIPEVNGMCIYMRDHPEKSEQDAAAHLRSLVNLNMQELVQLVFSPSAAPMACKKMFLNAATMAYYLYEDNDGWTSRSSKMQLHIRDMFFQPIV